MSERIAILTGGGELIQAGQWGQMASLRGTKIVNVPLEEAVGSLKYLDPEIYSIAEIFFG